MIKKLSTRIQNFLLLGTRGLHRAVDAVERAIRWMF